MDLYRFGIATTEEVQAMAEEGWYFCSGFPEMHAEWSELESIREPNQSNDWKGAGWYNLFEDWKYGGSGKYAAGWKP